MEGKAGQERYDRWRKKNPETKGLDMRSVRPEKRKRKGETVEK